MKSLENSTDLDRILGRLNALRPDSRAVWGRMSVGQMLCHLSDSFRLTLGEKQASDATSIVPRSMMRWVAFNMPFQWPRNVMTRPEMDQSIDGTPPAEFEADRAELVSLVRRFCNCDITAKHPMFGPMCRGDWMRWGYLHIDHHLRQFGV